MWKKIFILNWKKDNSNAKYIYLGVFVKWWNTLKASSYIFNEVQGSIKIYKLLKLTFFDAIQVFTTVSNS